MIPSALLFFLPVVVVDVSGDRVDPEHTRKLVAQELQVEAVAPDDPRAAQADGRIEVNGNAKDGKLTVRYRKVDEPVERSVPLPAEPARADSDAAYLAGNLARDEASELAGKKPAAAASVATPPSTPAFTSEASMDAARLAAMRGVLTHFSEEERAARVRGGIFAIGMGVPALAAGIYVFARDGADEPAKFGFATAMTAMGAVMVTVGTVVLLTKGGTYRPLMERLREEEAKGTSAGDVVEKVEKQWSRAAEEEKSARSSSAILGFIIGGLCIAGATYSVATKSGDGVSAATLGFAGGANVALSIGTLVTDGVVESSYRSWRTSKEAMTAERKPTISFGAAPVPGGAAASFAVTF